MNAMRCFVLFLIAAPLAANDAPANPLIDPPKFPAVAIEVPIKDIPLTEMISFPEAAFAAQHGPFVAIGGRKRGDQIDYLHGERINTLHKLQKLVLVWNSITGKRVAQIDLDEQAFDHPVAISPGGKWLVAVHKEKIIAHCPGGGEDVTVAKLAKIGPYNAAKGQAF